MTYVVLENCIRCKYMDCVEVCPVDWLSNDLALEEGTRLLSVYWSGETKFWIITEADRSQTTILLPSDY